MATRSRVEQQPYHLLPLSSQVFHILIALASGDQYGYAIMQDVANRTVGKLRLSPGTLYGTRGVGADGKLIGPSEGLWFGAPKRT